MRSSETARRFTNHDVNNDIGDVWQELGVDSVQWDTALMLKKQISDMCQHLALSVGSRNLRDLARCSVKLSAD